MRLASVAREAAELIKFPHTVFALPFALIAALAAADGFPPRQVVGWIVLAYSYSKRFTVLSHLWLGVGLGIAPLGARLGAQQAILAARGLHLVAALGLATFARFVGAGWGLWLGVAAAAALLAWQHSLVAPGHLERLDTAFFTANGALSLLMFVLYLLDMIVRA